MNGLPVLYSFRRCPYAIRARMALHCAGIDVDKIEVALRDKPPALLAVSPKGTVPVLVTPQGEVIDESLDIMRWALRQSDPDNWLADNPPGNTQRWLALNDETFKPLLDRYKYAGHHPEFTPQEHRTRAMKAFIQPLNAQLETAPWVAGLHAGLADVALFPFVRQFAGVDKAWFDNQPSPALQKWLNHWLGSNLFNAVMDKALKEPQTKTS